MNVEYTKFVELLEALRPGVARKEILEHATHFVFTGRQAITYNDRICVAAPFKTDFICSIKADEFLKLVKTIKAEELELGLITSNEKTAMSIKGGKFEAELAVAAENDVILGKIKELKLNTLARHWQPVPVDFIVAAQWCSFSASSDASREAEGLTCLHIKKKTVVSSDDARISKYTMDAPIQADILIPALNIEELIKFQVNQFCVIAPWAYFKTPGNIVFCTKLVSLEGRQYRNPDTLFDFEGHDVELPKGLSDALESAEIMAAGDYPMDKRIQVSIEKDVLTVYAENDALGWVRTKVKMPVRHATPVRFIINPMFLKQILEKTNLVKVGADRAMFQTETFVHLVQLHGE